VSEINTELSKMGSVSNSKIGKNVSYALPFILAIIPDLCSAALSLCLATYKTKQNTHKVNVESTKLRVPTIKKVPIVPTGGNGTERIKVERIGTDRNVRVCSKDDIKRIKDAILNYEKENGRSPNRTELAKAANIHKQKITDYYKKVPS
jgi:hypothetical protein